MFLDRDGVLIEDAPLLTDARDIRLIPGVALALKKLKTAGLRLIVVSNQAIVARGLSTESELRTLNKRIAELLVLDGAPRLKSFYCCPHHPNATLPAYRVNCDCRKPEPGFLLRAARDHGLDLRASFMVGDRLTDVIAGARAGCRTVLILSGEHEAPPIETSAPLDSSIIPDRACADLSEAADWILKVL